MSIKRVDFFIKGTEIERVIDGKEKEKGKGKRKKRNHREVPF